ncbi:MAG TPA: reverse transcriptase family protein [Planctomycetota bacterium]|nr:reverse transcriptase family protein [Planctomycetota bacterium]
MGLFDFLSRIFGGSPPAAGGAPSPSRPVGTKKQAPENSYDLGGYFRRPKKRYRATFSYEPPKYVRNEPYAMARRAFYPQDDHQFVDKSAGYRPHVLAKYNLPQIRTPEELALWLAVPLKTLVWLADYYDDLWQEPARKKNHYHYKKVQKRSSGVRLIEAPKAILKTIQKRILHEILDHVPAHPAAHGIRKGSSILSNASPHVGKKVVIKVDLADFYPRLVMKRVKAMFRAMGYNVEMCAWLAKLCTNKAGYDRDLPQFYYRRHLPQGAPTSPALANLCCFGLDVRLSGLAKKFNATYTRYADDLTFSGGEDLASPERTAALLWAVRKIIRDERFYANALKTRVLRKGTRQIVTGVVVNQKLNVSRSEFDRLKAVLTNCVRKGPATQNRHKHPNFKAHLQGRVAHVTRLNPARGAKLQRLLDKIAWAS